MYDWATILQALHQSLTPQSIVGLAIGLVIGFFIGIIPGATATMAVALTVPLTFGFATAPALMMLLAVYVSAIWTGSICAVLINIPGTVASAATTFDGYPMAKKGEAAKALAASSYSSLIGTLISGMILIGLTSVLAPVALKFGPIETCALALFGLSIVSTLSGGSALKGWGVALIGLLAATIGMAPQLGQPRFTFHNVNLLSGISVIPVIIGIFSIPEAIALALKGNSTFKVPERITGSPFLRWHEIVRIFPTSIRSSFIGAALGLIPAVGPETATFLGYWAAQKFSRYRALLGQGEMDGVAASEAASCAILGACLVPLLSFGIPGSAEAAAFEAGLLIHGIRPGPALFAQQLPMLWIVFVGFMIAVVGTFLLSLVSTMFSPAILRIPPVVLAPLIVVFSVIGAYGLSSNPFDVYVMLASGLFAYVLQVLGFSPIPLVLAIILGPIIETSLSEALAAYGGWSGLGTSLGVHPIAVAFLICALTAFALPILIAKQKHGEPGIERVAGAFQEAVSEGMAE